MAGLWLIASPYIFGYSGDGMLRFLAYESRRPRGCCWPPCKLWQDWGLKDEDMLKHGQ